MFCVSRLVQVAAKRLLFRQSIRKQLLSCYSALDFIESPIGHSNMPLPPGEHTLDWFVIPEMKGEKPTFLVYTKKGWVCRLCSSDHLESLEEHCKSADHVRYYEKLEERRAELLEMVSRQEKEIEEARYREAQQKRIAEQGRRQEELQREKESLSVRMAATERRAKLRSAISLGERMDVENSSSMNASPQERARKLRAQRLASSSSRDAASPQRGRQLRAQRLASENATKSIGGLRRVTPLDARREAKRQQVLETTRRHQQKLRKQEEEEARRLAAEKGHFQQKVEECFGCWPLDQCNR